MLALGTSGSRSNLNLHGNHVLTSNRNRFLGENVVSAEGDTWKRHRRITAPSFNQTTYRNVWTTTEGVYKDMLDREGWRIVDEAKVSNIGVLTHKVSDFLEVHNPPFTQLFSSRYS